MTDSTQPQESMDTGITTVVADRVIYEDGEDAAILESIGKYDLPHREVQTTALTLRDYEDATQITVAWGDSHSGLEIIVRDNLLNSLGGDDKVVGGCFYKEHAIRFLKEVLTRLEVENNKS